MKKIYFLAALSTLPFIADAQSAIDGFRLSQPDMKGTARFMSMGGAFGALGGDLSSLSVNPAGIGVYRRNEMGVTMDIDMHSATSEAQGFKNTQNGTKILLNNLGGVATWNLNSSTMPNINVGFTYNRAASFNGHYSGYIPTLKNSLTNYIAGLSNTEGATVADLSTIYDTDNFLMSDPYNPNVGEYAAPWLSILGYNSYFITPTGDDDQPEWIGQWGTTTTGEGAFDVVTSGGVSEYNITIGGNFSNKLFWGLDVGIVDLDYKVTSQWKESLVNAVVNNPKGIENSNALWNLTNYYTANGTGYNVKLGLIYRPIQELRIGLSFASPTWYAITENYIATTNFQYTVPIYEYDENGNLSTPTFASTNGGVPGINSYNFRTPWKLTASAAGVIGRNFIISADFEWEKYNKMRFYDGGGSFYDYDESGWPYLAPGQNASPSLLPTDYWYQQNAEIEEYYKSSTTLRLGAEYRITPRFSVRAGYAHVSSPVRKEAKDGQMMIVTSGTMPNFRMDNETNYITCGLGYNFDHFYIDAAFVHKRQSSEYHAYTPDPDHPEIPSPTSKLSLTNNQIVLSAGFRF